MRVELQESDCVASLSLTKSTKSCTIGCDSPFTKASAREKNRKKGCVWQRLWVGDDVLFTLDLI